MRRTIHLALYGEIEHPKPELDLAWNLFQSEALTRLRDVSLSSTPSRFAPHGMAASRFEHSVGVSYLARKLCDWRSSLRDRRQLLIAAALCHDIGSPPFSHIAEIFMYDRLGRTHEEQTLRLLGPGTELSELLRSYEVDPSEVLALIKGEHPELGPLIAGSIDLDNIDNSPHLLRSLGYSFASYHPLRLIRAFRIRGGELSLDSSYLSEILGWAECRRQLYDLLHSEPQLSSATMLYRALEFAYERGSLGREFFEMGESEALHHLRRQSGRKAGQLVQRALNWRHYHLLYEQLNGEEDPRLAGLYQDWAERKRLCDRLAAELKIADVDCALYVGRDRGEKSIELPFSGERAATVASLFANRSGPQRLAFFAAREHSELDPKRVEQAVQRALEELPEASVPAHVFF